MYFKYTVLQFKRMMPYSFTLMLLLIFHYIFNYYYSWDGVSLIVKMYLFAFSFFYIFNIGSDNIEKFRIEYKQDYGVLGDFILLIESRIMPYVLIYFVIILFTVTQYAQLPNWPWSSFIIVLDGRHSNLIIYSVMLLFVLKIRKNPFIATIIFFALAVFYSEGNDRFYSYVFAGPEIAIYKTFKMAVFFILITWDFNKTPFKIFQSVLISLVLAVLITGGIIRIYYTQYLISDINSSLKIESGLKLAKIGHPVALEYLYDNMTDTGNIDLFQKVVKLYKIYNKEFSMTKDNWNKLIFNNPVELSDKAAEDMVKEGIEINANNLIALAENESDKGNRLLISSGNIIRLTALNLSGREDYLKSKIENSKNEIFIIWGIKVLGETENCRSSLFLIKYLDSTKKEISDVAYQSLKSLTGISPVEEKNFHQNSPENIKEFKKFYLTKCKGD